MLSAHGLVVRLRRSVGLDRRLDSEIVAYVLGPPGCRLDVHADIDGWAILTEGGEAPWMVAADVPGVSLSFDLTQELLAQARPHDGAQLMALALQTVQAAPGDTPEVLASRAARTVLGSLVSVVARERAAGRGEGSPRTPAARESRAA